MNVEEEYARFPSRANRGSAWISRMPATTIPIEDRDVWRIAPIPTPVFHLGPCVFTGGRLKIGGGRCVEIKPWDYPDACSSPGVSASERHAIVSTVTRWLSWRKGDPEMQLSLPLKDPAMRVIETDDALAEFERSIPRAEGNWVCAFRDGRWAMLRFVALGKPAIELLESNNAMAFAMAHCRTDCEPGSPGWRDEIRKLLSMKRRDALARMGFEGTDQAEKVLRKVCITAISCESLDVLRRAMRKPKIVRRLADLWRIGPMVVRLARYPRVAEFLSPHAWSEAVVEEFPKSDEFVDEMLGWTNEVDVDFKGYHSLGLESACSLDALWQWGRARGIFFNRRERICRPPFRGNGDIRPMMTPRELLQEAETQKNCCDALIPWAAGGSFAYYRVLRPERATLALMVTGKTRFPWDWAIRELRGKANTDVSSKTRVAVSAWLEHSKFTPAEWLR